MQFQSLNHFYSSWVIYRRTIGLRGMNVRLKIICVSSNNVLSYVCLRVFVIVVCACARVCVGTVTL